MTDDELRDEFGRKMQAIIQRALKEMDENGELPDGIDVHVIAAGDEADIDGNPIPSELQEAIWQKKMRETLIKGVDLIGKTIQATMVCWQVWLPGHNEEEMQDFLRTFLAVVECMKNGTDKLKPGPGFVERHGEDKSEETEEFLLLAQAYAAAMSVFFEQVREAADRWPKAGRGQE